MLQIELNGKNVDLRGVDPDTPLLWVLRDHLGLTGTHYGCGKMLCGSCTVHVDGVSTRSCLLPIKNLQGRKVTTIEGLNSGTGQALQLAWVEEQVPQCGYCQSGQIMQADDLLANNPNPSDDDINQAMNGNLCRCMAYSRIKKAIKNAANGGGA